MEHFPNNFVRGKNVYFACFEVEKRKKQEKKGCFCATECVLFMIVSLANHFQKYSYLPGTGDTVISKAVPPGRDSSIALRLS